MDTLPCLFIPKVFDFIIFYIGAIIASSVNIVSKITYRGCHLPTVDENITTRRARQVGSKDSVIVIPRGIFASCILNYLKFNKLCDGLIFAVIALFSKNVIHITQILISNELYEPI
jgi:hypothetical protein